MMPMIPRCAAALLLAVCAAPRPVPPPPAPIPEARTVTTCVVSAGTLTKVQVRIDGATGDTTYQGQPFASAFPLTPQYAAGAEWYEQNVPIHSLLGRTRRPGDMRRPGHGRVRNR
jgi:hypothetical protein